MEAAISSSLSHPNIIQTYTYTIRPLCDNNSQQQQQQGSVSELGEGQTAEPSREGYSNISYGSINVHSYEV